MRQRYIKKIADTTAIYQKKFREAKKRQGMHCMVARISPRNRMLGNKALKLESQKKCSMCSIPCPGHRLRYCPNRRDRLKSLHTIDLSCTEKGFCPLERAGLTNLTECPLARNSDRAGRCKQAASTARREISSLLVHQTCVAPTIGTDRTSIPHRSHIPKPA